MPLSVVSWTSLSFVEMDGKVQLKIKKIKANNNFVSKTKKQTQILLTMVSKTHLQISTTLSLKGQKV